MRRWAQSCERLLVLSPDAVRRVPDLLDVDPARSSGRRTASTPRSSTGVPSPATTVAHWRRWLVDEPRGWGPDDHEPGSVSHDEDDLEAFADDNPVLLYVGRYTEVKRIPLHPSRVRARTRRASTTVRRS